MNDDDAHATPASDRVLQPRARNGGLVPRPSSDIAIPCSDSCLESRPRSGFERPCGERVERFVRGAAVASLSEAEFVRRIRRGGLAMWATQLDCDGRVSRYALEWDIGSGQTCTDAELAADLVLPILRQSWDTGPHASEQACLEWQGIRPASDFDRDTIELSARAMWDRMFTDAEAFNARLRRAAPFNDGEWAWAAQRLAGVFSAWAFRTEHPADAAAFSTVATRLGRSAEFWQSSGVLDGHIAEQTDLNRVCLALLQLLKPATGDPARESLLLLIQLESAVLAIAKAHRLRQEQRQAGVIDEAASALGDVTRRLYRCAVRQSWRRRTPP